MEKHNPTIHHRRSIRLKGYDYSQAGMYFVTICCQDKIYRFGKIENEEMILNDFGKIVCDEWIKLPERYSNVSLDVFQIMPNHIHGVIVLDEMRAVGAGLAPALNDNTVTLNDNTVTPDENTDTLNDSAVVLNDNVVALNNNAIAQNNGAEAFNGNRAGASPAPTAHTRNDGVNITKNTVGNIVGAYKSLVANQCLEIFKSKNEYMGKLWQRNYWEHIIRNEQSYQRIANYIINNPANWNNDKFYVE